MIIVRSFIVLLCTVVTTSIPDFLQFLDIFAAFGAAMVSFILPPFFYMKAFEKKIKRNEKIGCYLLVLFGIFGACYSIGNSLVEF